MGRQMRPSQYGRNWSEDDNLMAEAVANPPEQTTAPSSSRAMTRVQPLTNNQMDTALKRKIKERGGQLLTLNQAVGAVHSERKAVADRNETRRNVAKRRKWEADVATDHPHLVQAQPKGHDAPAVGRTQDAATLYQTGMTNAQIYAGKGWVTPHPHPGMDDVPLPGMEHPHAVNTPPRWDELSEEHRADIQRRVTQKTGATLDTMTADFGAQLDQAHVRADKYGAEPHTKQFYNDMREGQPKRVISDSARELGIPFPVHAAMNAFTSPQMKFEQNGRFPNNEIAVAAVKDAQAGVTEHEAYPPAGIQSGYPANYKKAVRHFHEHEEGVPLRDMKSEAGTSPFGPKTGPYHNSWLTSHPDFLVSDVHTGGGGMLPHLSSVKDETTTKSPREQGIEVKGFHSMADEAARRALRARGMNSLRTGQAAQWGEEKIQRGLDKPDKVFAQPAQEPAAGQTNLFDDDPTPGVGRTRRIR